MLTSPWSQNCGLDVSARRTCDILPVNSTVMLACCCMLFGLDASFMDITLLIWGRALRQIINFTIFERFYPTGVWKNCVEKVYHVLAQPQTIFKVWPDQSTEISSFCCIDVSLVPHWCITECHWSTYCTSIWVTRIQCLWSDKPPTPTRRAWPEN